MTPEDLLPLALSRPNEALEIARTVLADDPTPLQASFARQAIGIVLREFGDIGAAVDELRAALRLARASGATEREADVLGTLGVALVFAGRTASGRRSLDRGVQLSTGRLRGRSLFRRGAVLLILGRHEEALADLNNAIVALRQAGDRLWEARALSERGFSYLAVGSVHRASADLVRAEALFTASGQELESADATVHRGVLALRIGDLPAALTCFDEAGERFSELGTVAADLSIHRSAALLAAGLPKDALAEADAAIGRLEEVRGQSTKRAELLLSGANCALAAGLAGQALERAAQADRLFGQQGRRWWRAHARLALVRARFAVGPPTDRMLKDARRCARELAALGSPDRSLARLLVGQIALALGRTAVADENLVAVARERCRGPALSRAVGWLAEALRADAAGNPRQLLHACRRGLDVIDEHRSALGSSELRAQATSHGTELAIIGQRQALRMGQPRRLLTWSERWRASALAVPAVLPTDDEQAQADLAALRDVTSRLARAADGFSTTQLHREQLRLERAVRTRALRTRSVGKPDPNDLATGVFDIDDLLAELGDDRLLELVDIDGQLHVLVCGSGTVRRFAAGSTAQAGRELEFSRVMLTRLAYRMSALPPAEALSRLNRLGDVLNRALLAGAGGHLGAGKVIVVPPGRLHAVPWPLLTDLRSRTLTVAPSASFWLRARRTSRETKGAVVLVNGPGLESEGAEVPLLADQYADDELTLLGGGAATAPRVLAALDGARLAHIAAHGTFRADSPLFSALQLDDGPLTVYDLERLRRAPRQLVLSSCDSGVAAPAGSDELLGLVSALIPLGTTGIVASVVPVNDEAVVKLMTALHRQLRRGSTLAGALREARQGLESDPVDAATSWSFIALGAD